MAAEFGIDPDEMVSLTAVHRGPSVRGSARAMLAYLMRQLTPLSLSDIAKWCGYQGPASAKSAAFRIDYQVRTKHQVRCGPTRVEPAGVVISKIKARVTAKFK